MNPCDSIMIVQNADGMEQVKAEQQQLTFYQSCLSCCGTMTGCWKIWLPCICCCCKSPLYTLPTSKTGVLQLFGSYRRMIQPGFHIINPISESVIEIEMKTNVFTLAPQQVITKDNVTMNIQTVVYYRAVSPYRLVYKLRNDTQRIRSFIVEIAYAALRSVIGENTFQELLEHRTRIAKLLEEYVKEKVYPYGLYVQNIFIKDVILSEDTKRNLQSAAIQRRVSEATIISAQADVEAAKMMKESSDILSSTSAMQIRYLETIQTILSKAPNKSVFLSLKAKE